MQKHNLSKLDADFPLKCKSIYVSSCHSKKNFGCSLTNKGAYGAKHLACLHHNDWDINQNSTVEFTECNTGRLCTHILIRTNTNSYSLCFRPDAYTDLEWISLAQFYFKKYRTQKAGRLGGLASFNCRSSIFQVLIVTLMHRWYNWCPFIHSFYKKIGVRFELRLWWVIPSVINLQK